MMPKKRSLLNMDTMGLYRGTRKNLYAAARTMGNVQPLLDGNLGTVARRMGRVAVGRAYSRLEFGKASGLLSVGLELAAILAGRLLGGRGRR